MPKNLVSLSISALDELARLNDAQRLLDICLEQFESRDEESLNRIELLVDTYRARLSLHIDELETYLNNIRQLIGPMPPRD